MTYTNELEVEIDFSDVDPTLLEQSTENDSEVPVLASSKDKSKEENINSGSENLNSLDNQANLGLGTDEPRPTIAGRASRFFRKKTK
jgi:hypothetical protein